MVERIETGTLLCSHSSYYIPERKSLFPDLICFILYPDRSSFEEKAESELMLILSGMTFSVSYRFC